MKRIGIIGFACLSPSFICHRPRRLLRRRLRLLSRSLSEDLLRLLLLPTHRFEDKGELVGSIEMRLVEITGGTHARTHAQRPLR